MNTAKRPGRSTRSGTQSGARNGAKKYNFKKPGQRTGGKRTSAKPGGGFRDKNKSSRSSEGARSGKSRPQSGGFNRGSDSRGTTSRPTSGARNTSRPTTSRPSGNRGGSSRGSSSRSGGNASRGNFSRGGNRGGARGGNSRGGNRGGGRRIPTFDPSQFINKNPIEVKEEVYVSKHTFNDFGLDKRIVDAVDKMKIVTPSPIQDQIIPEIMNGNDVIGLAETGTGKTAAFLLPLLQKTLEDMDRQTLIMAPTRELAIQINDELKKLCRGFRMFSTVCVGGVNIRPQIKGLRKQNQFVIGTPGRLLDLIKQGEFDTTQVTTVVLDEADRMLDMGFIHDMRSILKTIPEDHETLFFSATMDKETEKLVDDFLNNPVTISVKKKDVTDSILQDVVPFMGRSKFETLVELFENPEFKRVIIFGAMKHSVKRLAQDLTHAGIKSESLHGNKTHGQRQNSLNAFKNGQAQVLVATDVAARGIHVDNVSHVINYDLPATFEDYVHRIGRTGRGEKRGKALTFVQGKKDK